MTLTREVLSGDSINKLLKEKLIEVYFRSRTSTDAKRTDKNLLVIFFCNNPSLVKGCISILGIFDHTIVIADFDLKRQLTQTPIKH